MAKNDRDENGLPVDKSPATHGTSDKEANAAINEELMTIAKANEEALTFEHEDDDEPTEVRVSKGIGINPSSTYPGRDVELAENDMRIPTGLDLARRADFAGTQFPERARWAGLAPGDTSGAADETETDEANG